MFEIPILLITYKRHHTLIEILEVIQKIKPKRLYISCDIYEGTKSDDITKNKTVIDFINSYTLNDCEIIKKINTSNLGCGQGPKEAIDWFFSHEKMGIIVEDDCLPDLSFFEYCKSMLYQYQTNNKIMAVTGNNYLLNQIQISDSYYFTKYPNIWGWATWKRSWDKLDWKMNDYVSFLKKDTLKKYTNSDEEYKFWKHLFDNLYNDPEAHKYWDYQWLYSIWNNDGFGIAPDINLVKNIGFDTEATHTTNKPNWYDTVKNGSFTLQSHPKSIEINQSADDFQFQHIINPTPKLSILDKIKNKLRRIFIKKKKIWQDNEYFDPIWQERIQMMSKFIKSDDSIVDLGCGKMWLKKFISPNNKYFPVDYIKRDEETIVCDFNQSQFPNIQSSIYFISGCLEYIDNYDWFISEISKHTDACILSYCSTDVFSDFAVRNNLMWKNHLSNNELIEIFKKKNFILKEHLVTEHNNHIFYFTK